MNTVNEKLRKTFPAKIPTASPKIVVTIIIKKILKKSRNPCLGYNKSLSSNIMKKITG